MSVKERILTIRLMEKAQAAPVWAEALGIVIAQCPQTPGTPAALDAENPAP